MGTGRRACRVEGGEGGDRPAAGERSEQGWGRASHPGKLSGYVPTERASDTPQTGCCMSASPSFPGFLERKGPFRLISQTRKHSVARTPRRDVRKAL